MLVNPLSTLNVKIFYIKSNIFTLRTSNCKKSTLSVKHFYIKGSFYIKGCDNRYLGHVKRISSPRALK